MNKRWTDPEKALIKRHYPTAPRADMLKLLPGRTWGAIQSKASALGVNRQVDNGDSLESTMRVSYRDDAQRQTINAARMSPAEKADLLAAAAGVGVKRALWVIKTL